MYILIYICILHSNTSCLATLFTHPSHVFLKQYARPARPSIIFGTQIKIFLMKSELLKKVVIFVFFAHKNYSHSFIKLRLNHWCHMDYFNNALTINYIIFIFGANYPFKCLLCIFVVFETWKLYSRISVFYDLWGTTHVISVDPGGGGGGGGGGVWLVTAWCLNRANGLELLPK